MQLEQLMAQDPSVKEEYARIKKLFDSGSEYNYPQLSDTNVAWNNFSQLINDRKAKSVSMDVTRKRSSYRFLIPVAAVILLVAGGLWWFGQDQEKPLTVYTGDDSGVIELKDGSLVHLKEHSTISLYEKNFGQNARELKLNGTAFFEVKKAKTPFRITSGELIVTVTGTAFEVSDGKSVHVRDGKVNVELDHLSERNVIRNEKIVLQPNGRLEIDKVPFEGNYPGWTESNLQFSEQRLEVILEVVRSHYDVVISAPDNMKDERFTIDLSGLDLKTALETIATVTNTVLQKTDDSYTLKP